MSAFFKSSGTPGAGLPWDSPPATPQKGTEPLSAEVKEPRIIPLKMCQVSRKQCPPDTENRYCKGRVMEMLFLQMSQTSVLSSFCVLWSLLIQSFICGFQVFRGHFCQQEELCVSAGKRPSNGSVLVQWDSGRRCQPVTKSEGGDEAHAARNGSETSGLGFRTGL